MTREKSQASRLHRLDRQALDFALVETLQYAGNGLAHLPSHARFWNEKANVLETFADKVVAETALLVLLADRVRGPSAALRRVRMELIRDLVPLARSDRLRLLIMRYPQTACSLGFAHTALTASGVPDDEFDAVVTSAFQSGQVYATDRLPFRSMDVVWQEGLRSPGRLGCIQHQLEGSILIADPPPSACSVIPEEAYALAHAIFYTTDFGQRPLPEKVDRERLRFTVDAVLAWRLAREDFDLIGELLLAVCCSGMEWSPHCWLAWRTLVDAREQLGELPSPNLDSLHRDALSPVEARAYTYRHTYHTMYVFGLLCAQLLGFPETAPPALAGQVTDDADGGALGCNAAYSRASATRGRLAMEWPECSTSAEEASEVSFGAHRDRLDHLLNFADPEGTLLFLRGAVLNSDIDWKVVAGVLMDCALVRSARAYDLPRAAYGLLEVVRLSLPPSRVSLDVAEFLARQQFRADVARHPLPVSQATSEVLQARDFIVSSLSVFARALRESGRSDVMTSPVVNEY